MSTTQVQKFVGWNLAGGVFHSAELDEKLRTSGVLDSICSSQIEDPLWVFLVQEFPLPRFLSDPG